jgi:hypothetical protein
VSVSGLNPASAQSINILYPRPPTRTQLGTTANVRPYWESLVEQVTEAGLLLGTRFEIPRPT